MEKKLLKFAAWTSLLCLVPLLTGALLWNQLPEQMVHHWNAQGVADGWADRWAVVASTPLLLFAVHWLMVGLMQLDRRTINGNPMIARLIMLILPVVSNVVSGFVYAEALGVDILGGNLLGMVLMGLFFLVMGNYLPKCRRSATMGIRLPWTMENDENWNRTHRFGGKVMFFGGLVILLGAMLPMDLGMWVVLAAVMAVAVLPVGYSYLLYRSMQRQGTWTATPIREIPRWLRWVLRGILAAALVGVFFLCFTGNIDFVFRGDSFTIESDFWEDMTVSYTRIDSVELRTEPVSGSRTFGLGSPRLLCGTFVNEEFGTYTRYTYTACDSAVILRNGDAVLVLSDTDDAATEALYHRLLAHLEV